MKGKEAKGTPKTYLVEVAPVSKSPFARRLSYFSTERIALGTFVRVPLREKPILAITLSCKDVRLAKSNIRKADFSLKKIRKADILSARLEGAALAALEECARFYATPLSTLLSLVLPKFVTEKPEAFFSEAPRPGRSEGAAPEIMLFQIESEERYGQYRALVRQSFARNKSLMFVVPTHHDAARARAALERGVGEFVHVFSLESGSREAARAWLKAKEEKHPILFVTTPAGLLFSRPDLETIIVERVNSRAYRSLARPFIDFRRLAETLAAHRDAPLTFGDAVLPVELLWREKRGFRKKTRGISELSLLRFRLPAAPAKIVGAASRLEDGTFEIFTPELKALMVKALSEKGPEGTPGRIFLFGARKGLAPTTVCGDCGTLLPCENCGAPVVLHKRKDEHIYVCHACGATREASTLCGMCKSWRLIPLGVGTEETARQAALLFPGVPVEILDKEHAPTEKRAREIAERFEKRGGILVGTELAFYHLESVPYAGLVSLDALFSIPDFYINERVFYLVSRLRELTREECVIQTRRGFAGAQVIAWAAQGNITDFYQKEIEERELVSYPPFSLFIKVSVEPEHLPALQRIRERLAPWQPDLIRHSLVMRVPREGYPEEALTRELSLLGPEFSIKVDPESIL